MPYMLRIALCISVQIQVALVAVNMIRGTEYTSGCSLYHYRFKDVT
jgi:hypothetical protein